MSTFFAVVGGNPFEVNEGEGEGEEETPPAPPERTVRTISSNGISSGGVVTEIDRPLPQKPTKNSAFSKFRMGGGGANGKRSNIETQICKEPLEIFRSFPSEVISIVV